MKSGLITLQGSGINWTWYLRGCIDDEAQTIEVLEHGRLHNERDPDHPDCKFGFRNVEARGKTEDGLITDRVLMHVEIWNMRTNTSRKFKVTNRRHVFDYPVLAEERQ